MTENVALKKLSVEKKFVLGQSMMDVVQKIGVSAELARCLNLMKSTLYEERLAKDIVGENQIIEAQGTQVFKRSAGLFLCSQIMKNNPDLDLKLKLFDIEKFKALDRMVEGYNLADLTLNNLCRKLDDAILKANSLDQNRVLFYFRYGGDEFIIVQGSKTGTTENMDSVIDFNFQTDHLIRNVFSELNLGLKNDDIQTILVPKEPDKKEIFTYFLKHNLLLTKSDVQKIADSGDPLENVSLKPIENMRISPNASLIYTIKESYIVKNNPEVSHNLLEYYNQVMLKPHLKEYILSPQEFHNVCLIHPIKSIITIDSKLLKEINDRYNHLEGDKYMNQTLQQIMACIDKTELNKAIFIASEGSVIEIGIHEKALDTYLTETSMLKEFLETINHEKIINGRSYKLPMGVSLQVGKSTRDWYREIGESRVLPRDRKIRNQLIKHVRSKGFDVANQNWYRSVLSCYSEAEIISEFKLFMLKKTQDVSNSNYNSTLDMLMQFFLGANSQLNISLSERYITRMATLRDFANAQGLNELAEFSQNVLDSRI
jgi:GGDEF domain-containing protein